MIKINGKEIRINRENAVISETDVAYCELVKKILEEGVQTHNRTGIDTLSIAGWTYKFDLQKGFPIAETKLVKAKNLSNEIQWIHQEQSNVVKWLTDRDNHTWDLWVVDEDGIYRTYEQGDNAVVDPDRMVPLKRKVFNPLIGDTVNIPVLRNGEPIMVKPFTECDKKGNPLTIKEALLYGKEYAGTIGEAYGFINNTYRRPQFVEHKLKTDPTDRRMIISLWQDAHLINAVLPSCVWNITFKVTPDNKLHAVVEQRSADVPLGLPFNISQYALLLSMFAKANGYEVGTMTWVIMDAHIYVNQLPGIKKQLQRYYYMQEYENLIQTSTDEEVERAYNNVVEYFNNVERAVVEYLHVDIKDMKMSERYKLLSIANEGLAKDYQEAFERKVCFEHMLTRETPALELASHDSVFKYSTEYVKEGDPYLKENPIGNKELVLKNYHPTPFISMPIAQ
jgi:thymidylate synthase